MGKVWWILAAVGIALIIYLTCNAKKSGSTPEEEETAAAEQSAPQEASQEEMSVKNEQTEAVSSESTAPVPETEGAAEPARINSETAGADLSAVTPAPIDPEQSRMTQEYVEWLESGNAFDAPKAPDLAKEYFESPEISGKEEETDK